MKITEIILVPNKHEDTKSSAKSEDQIQDVVVMDFEGMIDEHPDHSAITEGVSQIFRRKKSGSPQKGFRCTSGPRKGRIVAKPSTCFQKLDVGKSAKIKKKRRQKAKLAGLKMARTKRSGAGSLRLKGAQIKKVRGSQPRHGKSSRSGARPLMKSKTVKVKK